MNKLPMSVSHDWSAARCPRKRSPLQLVLAVTAALIALLGGARPVHAGYYQVYTSSTIGAMTLNANDGYCSLAEAVASANAGASRYNCPDGSPGGDQTILLAETPGKPFSTHPYTIGSLTINSPGRHVLISSASNNARGQINTTGLSGFIIRSGTATTFWAVNLTYTGGASGGRLIENYGSINVYSVVLSKGNVTAHAYGLGGAIYNEGTIGDLGSGVEILNNKAKRGGGIYNNDGRINNLTATISGNSATMAGGGIYNMSSVYVNDEPKAQIDGHGATITNNSAKAGGGIFNRGEMNLYDSAVTNNTASGTGSNETCSGGLSCDGNGGGVLTMPFSTRYARFNLMSLTPGATTLSNNTASGLGGATYSAGILNLWGIIIANNKARSGGAIYSVADGPSWYCSIGADAQTGDTLIFGNLTAPSGGYSVVDTAGTIRCSFERPGEAGVWAWGNINPVCKPGTATPACPQ
jgi:hypothetical protein